MWLPSRKRDRHNGYVCGLLVVFPALSGRSQHGGSVFIGQSQQVHACGSVHWRKRAWYLFQCKGINLLIHSFLSFDFSLSLYLSVSLSLSLFKCPRPHTTMSSMTDVNVRSLSLSLSFSMQDDIYHL